MTKQKSDKQALDNIVESAEHLEQVYKRDSQFGDLVIITTQNSVYSAILFQAVFLIVKAFLP